MVAARGGAEEDRNLLDKSRCRSGWVADVGAEPGPPVHAYVLCDTTTMVHVLVLVLLVSRNEGRPTYGTCSNAGGKRLVAGEF